MRRAHWRGLFAVPPLALSMALILSACGGGSDNADNSAQQESSVGTDTPGVATGTTAATESAPVAGGTSTSTPGVGAAGSVPAAPGSDAAPVTNSAPGSTSGKPGKAGSGKTASTAGAAAGITSIDSPAQQAENALLAQQKGGATDVGVTKDSIKMGSVSMHGVALGNLLVTPIVNGVKATFASINDRGGVLGRRMSLVDCDDGPGEVSRSKACIKKLVGQDKVFALLGYTSWASASVHADLAQYKLPSVGVWAYSQTEWQDPYMFPSHMSMVHEAMANAQWVKNVIKPKTYGLICLTSPEMQLSCNEVQRILDASGAKLVKKLDTVSDPNGTPSGFQPDPDQFVIYMHK